LRPPIADYFTSTRSTCCPIISWTCCWTRRPAAFIRVERDGLSLSHPARFLLVGTMNPEEGELRPQLLDRFGLAVDVGDLTDPADRPRPCVAVSRSRATRRISRDPGKTPTPAEAERIVRAQRLLPEVSVSDTILRMVSERCLAAGVEGLRADLTVCKAACAWAAYQGRRDVDFADVDAVAELALAHRRKPPKRSRAAWSQFAAVSAEWRRTRTGERGA